MIRVLSLLFFCLSSATISSYEFHMSRQTFTKGLVLPLVTLYKQNAASSAHKTEGLASAEDIVLGDADMQVVQRKCNTIKFIGPVSQRSCSALCSALEDAESECLQLQKLYSLDKVPNIKLHIQSPGGEFLPSLAVIDSIAASSVPVHSYICGFAASAATFISVSCHKRYAQAHSMALLHQLSSASSGKADAMQDDMKNIDLFMSLIKDIYLSKTKIKESEIDDLLSHDLWFSANDMLDRGIVDEIV